MTKRDTTYNGWRNRPTWNVHLWLSNEEGLYNAARTTCTEARNLADAAHFLRELCFDVWPKRVTPDGDDLFKVNWRDVAKAFRE